MARTSSIALALVLAAATATSSARAGEAAPQPSPTPNVETAVEQPVEQPVEQQAEPLSPVAAAIKTALSVSPSEDASDEVKKEAAALLEFYNARRHEPLWTDAKGLNEKAASVIAEIGKAADYGLDPAGIAFPKTGDNAENLAPQAQAETEIALARAVLQYARFARGGRIIAPSELLNTNLDRRPQLLDPKAVLDGIATAPDAAAYLAGTHPQHAQFQRLREKLLELRASPKSKKSTAEERRILANMEMWRWMWADLGDLYIMANVPEYMIRFVKNGEVVLTERIVVGELDKQTSIYTRNLKSISFRPLWRVPESIKVRELWPSLLKGGALMRQYGLEVETKDGRPLDYRTMDWTKADIREYEVIQPPGPKSVLGYVKFNFPSQHTIFMHDTPDKWMFNSRQRTLSHGCLRLRNPLKMAELVMAEDKGWDAAKITELVKSGPLNNEVMLDKKVRMHITYFTAAVDETGKLQTWPDIYGHEKRVALALEGRWKEINKGKDHLAPVELSSAVIKPTEPRKKSTQTSAGADFMNSFTGGMP